VSVTRHGQPAFFACLAVAGCFSASLAVTGGDATLQISLAVYSAMVLVAFAHPVAGVAMTMALMLVPLLQVGMDLALDTRYLAMPLIAIVAMRALAGDLRPDPGSGPRIERVPASDEPARQLPTLLAFALPAMMVFGLLSLGWTHDKAQTTDSVLALAAGSALIFAVRRTVDAGQLVRMLAVGASLVIVISLAALVFAPGSAFLAMRGRGVFFNANSFAAFLVVSTPLILIHLRRTRWPVAAVLFALVALTASRAGTLAVLVELLVFLIATRRRGTRLPIAIGAAVTLGLAAGVLRQWTDTGLLLVLRSNNSRAVEWSGALEVWREHPLLGVGLSALPLDAAGLFPYLLAASGVVGTALAGVFIVAACARAFRAGPMYAALVAGCLVDVVFEPWLFTAGSLFCLMFWLVASHPGTALHGVPSAPESTTRGNAANCSPAPSLSGAARGG
jgi:O-antigen ligase